jgi:hypothetical protein
MAAGLVTLALFAATSLFALGGGKNGIAVLALQGSEKSSREDEDGPSKMLTRGELQELLDRVRIDDYRIMRWHARSKTRKAQRLGGCDALPPALDLLVATTKTTTKAATTTIMASGEDAAAEAEAKDEDDDDERSALQALALEYATFCITDNPSNRAKLAQQDGIYQAVVQLLKSSKPAVASAAAHVIYIASFANKANHFGFFRAGAVSALVDTVLRYDDGSRRPVDGGADATASADSAAVPSEAAPGMVVRADQAMWALAALQNLAASYCDTENDGRCYWRWGGHADGSSAFHTLSVEEDSLPVTSEGTSMRLTTLKEPRLVPHLVHLTCDLSVLQGGEMTDTNPFPGDNARVGRDENSSNLVSWAAAGALKNLGLDPEGRRQMKDLESVLLPCLCRIARRSGDWLERNKAEGLLGHLRYGGNPCWWSRDEVEDEENRVLECIDANYADGEGYHCGDYGHASEDECRAPDAIHKSLLASEACCGCGGGMRLVQPASRQDKEL